MLGHREMFSFQQTTTSLRQIVDAVIPPADTDALEEKQSTAGYRPHRAERVRRDHGGHAQRRLPDGGTGQHCFLSGKHAFYLVARGSAARPLCRRDSLRRKNVVTLTVRGRRTLTRAITSSNDAERRFLASLPEDEAIRFRRALRALVHAPG
jgi:hypothetical protein